MEAKMEEIKSGEVSLETEGSKRRSGSYISSLFLFAKNYDFYDSPCDMHGPCQSLWKWTWIRQIPISFKKKLAKLFTEKGYNTASIKEAQVRKC